MTVMPVDIPARQRLFLPAALIILGLMPAGAQARIVEMGRTAAEPTPSCPGKPCLAVSRTTGYQAKVGAERDLFKVPADGKIVAWTIRLGDPDKRQIAFFDKNYGGEAAAGITVIRPGRRLYARVTGASPVEKLQPYFGESVQFPLGRSLTVKKGYIVALTVPSWAPALAIGYGNDHSWRASRSKTSCTNTETQTAQTTPGAITRFSCLYRTARLTYSVTLITDPQPRKRD